MIPKDMSHFVNRWTEADHYYSAEAFIYPFENPRPQNEPVVILSGYEIPHKTKKLGIIRHAEAYVYLPNSEDREDDPHRRYGYIRILQNLQDTDTRRIGEWMDRVKAYVADNRHTLKYDVHLPFTEPYTALTGG